MFDFRLTPAYCLFNGVAILEQKGADILFLMENLEDIVLKGRLRRAFENYLEAVVNQSECPEIFRKEAHVDFVQGTREQLRKCVSGLYKVEKDAFETADENCGEVKKKDAAAVLLLDTILLDARDLKATDIHIEGNAVRFRIKGKLEKRLELQPERCGELIQRVKLLAGMNVIEKRRSQDGRFVYGMNKPVFIRVSSVGIIGNDNDGQESLVLRLLDTTRVPLSINLLGFNDNQLKVISMVKSLKNGLFLVCGPTGAGKSTTVASMLVEMERAYKGKVKIISLEDPPEYVIPGVTQIQIDETRGNTFKSALDHVFRQDPDVIMIGEIRDELSASAAIRAALTGHLVFATLHTGGAGEAVIRMENLGIERKLLGSVIKGIICQELNYKNGESELCADVAVPKTSFGASLRPYFCEDQIDELFIHTTNYSEVLEKTLTSFKKALGGVAGVKTTGRKSSEKLWGGRNGKKVHEEAG